MSSSAEGEPAASSGSEPTGTLRYDVALPYAAGHDRLLLPRLRIDLQFHARQTAPIPVVALLDTGAELSAFDGRIAQQTGLSLDEIAGHAPEVKPMYGFTRRGPPVAGYVHEGTCYIAFGARFAELRFRAVIMPPNTLAFPILGRAGCFEQVDVTFAELEKMLYLRFRNPALQSLFG